jgi:hypothetical protein
MNEDRFPEMGIDFFCFSIKLSQSNKLRKP